MVFLFIISIIFFIVIINKKDEEIKKLKQNSNNIKFCPNCGFNLVENQPQNKTTVVSKQTNSSYKQNNTKPIKKYNEQEIKNNSILIVGSILMILGAIVFLTTTWNITHNFIKTLVIILMLLVFMGVSYIADKYFKLKDTAKTFYYISLAYVPLILISISYFSLLGDYLSINGNGKYIYFSLCSIGLTTLYYYCAKKKQSKLIEIASVIFSVLSVISITAIFTNQFNIILLTLMIYTIVISLIYKNNYQILTKEVHKKSVYTLIISLGTLILYNNIWNIVINNAIFIDILLDILLIINLYYLLNKITNNKNIYNLLNPLLIVFTFSNLSALFNSFNTVQTLVIISFIIIYLYDLITSKKIKEESTIEVLICSVIVYISTLIYGISHINIIESYFIIIIETILLGISYYFNKKDNYLPFIISFGILLSILNILITLDLPLIIFGYCTLIMVISSILIKDNNLQNFFKWLGNISLIVFTLLYYENSFYLLILYTVYLLYTFIYSYHKNDNIYKIISYVYSNIAVLSLFDLINIIDINYLILCIPLTTVLIIGLEFLMPKLKNEYNIGYIMTSLSLSLIILNIITDSIQNFMYLIGIIAFFFIYIFKNNIDKRCLYLPLIAIIPYIYDKGIFIINEINYMYFISLILIIITISLAFIKKEKMYSIMFYIYTFFHIINFDESKYISLSILLIGTIIIYLIEENKIKDLLKALIYILIFILLEFIVFDLKINTISIFTYGLGLVLTSIISRDIIKKHSVDYKVFIYIFFIIINLITLTNYSSEFDGIIFVCLLTIFVIISYLYKFGPEFIICLSFILINVLLLTRTFWLSIPWWLYILLIGGTLISFAIYNEVKSKESKNKKNKLIKIKDNLDL